MKKTEALSLESRIIGALPIINSFLSRIELGSLLGEYVASRWNQKLSHAQTIELLVRNILIEREPLYKLSEWSAEFDPTLVGLQQTSPSALNDDRVGRSLDALFDADRASLMTRIVLKVVDEFDIDLQQCHNDSTTVTVHGQYTSNVSVNSTPSLCENYSMAG